MKGGGERLNYRAIAAMVVLSAALGALNNMHVDEERRVPWSGWGDDEAEETDVQNPD